MRTRLLVTLTFFLSIAILGFAAPANGFQTAGPIDGGGDADHSGLTVGLSGGGDFTSSGGDSGCVYGPDSLALPATGDPSQFTLINSDGTVTVGVNYDCDPDTPGVDGFLLVELADLAALSLLAFDAVPWPPLEPRPGMANPVAGFPIPLVLEDPGGTTFATPFTATAADAGVIVTATAVATEVVWETGNINSHWQARVGGPWPTDETICVDFGKDLIAPPPAIWDAIPTQAQYGCVTAFRGSSHTEPGQRVTLEAIVTYEITYATNITGAPISFGPAVFDNDFATAPIQVREIQTVGIAQ